MAVPAPRVLEPAATAPRVGKNNNDNNNNSIRSIEKQVRN
jgi:hypothetical protein